MRKAIVVLFGLVLIGGIWPNAAEARGGLYAGYRGVGWYRPFYRPVAFGWSYGVISGYPLDDSFDLPYGYGEYAEYGPWTYRRYAEDGCHITRKRVRTAFGARWRAVTLCN